MIRLKQAVIVEGKYDKITLENVIDALVIPTDGFAIFKNREKCELIRTLARRDGIIVLTDSDSAGQVIRSYIKRICPDGKIIPVYVPQLAGKERRKRTPSKEGFLGVEGMSPEILREAFLRSGVTVSESEKSAEKIRKTDLFRYGLSGGENSAGKRREFSMALGLPREMSANAFLDVLNVMYTPREFEERVKLWLQEADKK